MIKQLMFLKYDDFGKVKNTKIENKSVFKILSYWIPNYSQQRTSNYCCCVVALEFCEWLFVSFLETRGKRLKVVSIYGCFFGGGGKGVVAWVFTTVFMVRAEGNNVVFSFWFSFDDQRRRSISNHPFLFFFFKSDVFFFCENQNEKPP